MARLGIVLVIALAFFGLSPLPAHGESRPTYGKTLVASLLEEPLVVDPLAARSYTDMTVISLLFDTLYREEDGVLVPHLAAALPDSSDPQHVVVRLRPSVQFHDGSPLRAQDVVASLERLLRSDLGFLLETVKSVRVGTKKNDEQLASIALTLRRSDPELAKKLADLHTSVVARGKAPGWRRLVGSGAWRLGQRSARKRALILIPFESHFAGRVYLNSLVLNWHTSPEAEARKYEAGGSHISARGKIAFAGHRPKFETNRAEGDISVLSYLGFGTASAIVKEPVFRRAVSAAMGRAGMRQIGTGESVSPTITVVPARKAPRPFALRANTKVATALLTSLGGSYPDAAANTLTLQLLVNTSRPDDAVTAARVAAGLYELGITTRIVSLPASVFAGRVKAGDCDLYVGQLAESGSSPHAQLRKALVIGGEAKTAQRFSGASRAAIERHLASAVPIVPLFHRSLRLHYRSDVKGVGYSAAKTLRFPSIFLYGAPGKN